MTSTFGWLDNDDEQRRRMIEVVELFREQGTVDELGIGSIRDTLSNALFPGTSTLHTRLRYVLFLPWLMEQASHEDTASRMREQFTELEYRLIDSLKAGGEEEGVMGNVAGRRLKRLPSVAYWSALGAWGLVDAASVDAFFRRRIDFRRLTARTASADEGESGERTPGNGLDSGIPPAPDALVKATDFALSRGEEEYLSDRIATHTRGSMLAWLVANKPGNVDPEIDEGLAPHPWEISNLGDLDTELATLVEHARRFSLLMNGATLIYNVALARRGNRDDALSAHEVALAEWEESDEDPRQVAATWDSTSWWSLILDSNPQIRPGTRHFVDAWVGLVASGKDLANSTDAALLVANRERQIKGGRARFVSQSALDRWSGSSGLSRLDYRWGITRAHLLDLYAAREAQ